MNPFAPLADRDFRLYFTGEVFSSAGSGLHIVALGWYLLERTGSATSVALVWALGLGSGIVVLPFAGPLADRYPRRVLAIAADLARLVLVVAMAVLAYAGSPSLPALYVLTFLVGLGQSVFWPSITALLQQLIRPDQLAAASRMRSRPPPSSRSTTGRLLPKGPTSRVWRWRARGSRTCAAIRPWPASASRASSRGSRRSA